MLNALQSVFSVIAMIALGFFLAKRKWFEGNSSALISRLVVSVALPAYMISNLMSSYDKAKLLSMLPGLPIPFLAMLGSFLIASGLAVVLRVPRGRRGTFASMFSLANAVFIGLPVNLLLFGDEALPFALLYYIANTTVFWTLGTYCIASDGAIRSGRAKPSLVSTAGLKRILSPPLLGFIAAILMIMAGISLPKSIMDLCKYLGNMTTPLSMLFVGIVISRIELKKMRFGLDIAFVLAGRFLVTPLLIFLLMRGRDLPLLMKQVFLITSAMPAMTQTPILAEAYGADAEYAGIGTSLTTVLSMITIPVYMGFVGRLF
ncbi:MAG TPA: AEC family transporter [Rectinemataceae bacterium]|nr:AEC family transporter [Rectinemataceae bacterium]